ncbi:MAG: hypothetical protein LPH21_02525 [Shewanella sp.]|nr:hypothetical protein [Shewanella sp.]MCF1456470.1 hypothetical protein [Shewanella sp.]
MKDILTNWLKDNQVKVTSPVIGAFISAWVLFNWDKFLLLFWGAGELPERLKLFQESNSFSDPHYWLSPLILAMIYVFGMPYLNVITQKLKRHAELMRYREVVDTDIEKEKKLCELNEAKYKSNPDNDYIGRKIKADIEQIESNAKKATAEAEAAQSDAESKSALATKSKAEAEKASLELKKQKLLEEKELIAHERAKALHDNMIVSSQFPTLYEYISELSKMLHEDDIHLKIDTITDAIAITFGFDSGIEILTEKNFNLKFIQSLSLVIFEPDRLLSELKKLVDSDETVTIDESDLFDYLIQLFETIEHCRLVSSESLEDEAISYFEDNQFDLLQEDGIAGAMAETNAYFDEVSDYQVQSVEFDSSVNRWEVKISCVVSGTNHEERMFYGDSIQTSLIIAYPIVLGRNGAESPHFTDVSGSVIHPGIEDDEEIAS